MTDSKDDVEFYPLSNTSDTEILMHRDAHFGGKFEIMVEYYKQNGKGVNPDFELERILELALIEREMQQNLAATLLSGAEAEKVALAKDYYKKLRDLYEIKEQKSKIPRLIADLILSEEEEPTAEIAALVAEKKAAVPFLLDLMKTEDLYDPLFPGFGLAPLHAAKALGEIKDKSAIITLFEAIDESDFSHEDVVLKALKALGEDAKQFLLRVLHGKPYNHDNEKAALALLQFNEDPEVLQMALDLLSDKDTRKNIPLSTYLVLICEALQDPEQRKKFQEVAEEKETPSMIRTDMRAIAKEWAKN